MKRIPTTILPLVLTLCLIGSTGFLAAEHSVRSLFTNRGADWLVGSWEGVNDKGVEIELDHEWELSGQALEVKLSVGGRDFEGMIVRDPANGQLTELGVDDQGMVTRAIWRPEADSVVSERIATTAEGHVVRMAIINRKTGTDTVTATVHRLSEDGEIGMEGLDTVRSERD